MDLETENQPTNQLTKHQKQVISFSFEPLLLFFELRTRTTTLLKHQINKSKENYIARSIIFSS